MKRRLAAWPRILHLLLAMVFALLTTTILLGHLVPDLANFWRPHAPVHVDYPVVQSMLDLTREMIHDAGRPWGYDPHFMAGWIDPLLWHNDVFFALVSILFLSTDSGTFLYYCLLAFILLTPVLVLAPFRSLGRTWPATIAGGAILYLPALFGIGILFLGVCMQAAYLVGFGCIIAFASTLAWLEEPDARFRVGMLLLPLVPLMHKTAVLILAGPIGFAVLVHAKSLTRRKLAILGGLVAAALIVNLIWIVPLFRYRQLLDFQYSPNFTGVPFLYLLEGATYGLYGVWLLRAALAVMATTWIIREYRHKRMRVASCHVFNALYFGLLITWGHCVSGLHEARYVFNFSLFLALPAGLLAGEFLIWRGGKRWTAMALLALGVGTLWFLPTYRQLLRFHSRDGVWESRFTAHIGSLPMEDLSHVSLWLRENGNDGRVFVESSTQTDYTHYLIGKWSTRPLINGPYPFIFFRQNAPSFALQSLLCPQFVDEATSRELPIHEATGGAGILELATLYNVRWFVLTDDRRIRGQIRNGIPFELRTTFGQFKVYELDIGGSYFFRGTGSVRADRKAIFLSDVKADVQQGDVVIKFQWSPGLRASDGSAVSSWPVRHAPTGLIRVQNPTPEFRIFLD